MPSTNPGPRDHLLTRALQAAMAELDDDLLVESDLDPAEAPERLARHLMNEVRLVLGRDDESADKQAQETNELLRQALASDGAGVDGAKLRSRRAYCKASRSGRRSAIRAAAAAAGDAVQPERPARQRRRPAQHRLRAASREPATADPVDLICAFVIWSGVRHLREALAAVVERGGAVRVITTTYMGATEKRAVDELVRLGAEVRVALDARTTKLHAKAWLLERASGLTTAFVGSSNLSHTALFDGLEWNVRLSSMDAAHVIDRVRMTFESHWASEHFEPYDPAVNGEELERALSEHDRRSLGEASTISFANLDVRPYPHQQRMLEALTIERERHDRHRNLVVAATGTGKTVVAALDYRQLVERAAATCRCSSSRIARRSCGSRWRRIARSCATARSARSTAAAGSPRARMSSRWSSRCRDRLEQIAADAFDVVVVDEFHHAAARDLRPAPQPPRIQRSCSA